jgi:hypothetical protein
LGCCPWACPAEWIMSLKVTKSRVSLRAPSCKTLINLTVYGRSAQAQACECLNGCHTLLLFYLVRSFIAKEMCLKEAHSGFEPESPVHFKTWTWNAGKGGYTLVTLPRTVTSYRDSVDGTRDHVTYQKLVMQKRYGRCRYLAVASKGWYSYGLSRSGRAAWHVTTVRSSPLLYVHYACGSRNKLGTSWCNTRRILLHHEARDESSDRKSVSCQSLATLRRYGTQ